MTLALDGRRSRAPRDGAGPRHAGGVRDARRAGGSTIRPCARRSIRLAPWLAWAVVALCVGLGVAGSIVTVVADAPLELGFIVPASILFTACVVLGAVVVTNEPRNVVGWVLVSFALMPAALLPLNVYAGQGTGPGETQLPGAVAAEIVQSAFGAAASFLPFILLLHVFPTGRTLGGWWRGIAWASAVVLLVASISDAFLRREMEYANGPNPVDWLPETPFQVLQGIAILGIPLALAAAVVRFRRARGVEREQLKWVAYAGTLTAVTVVIGVLVNQVAGSDSPSGAVIWALSATAFATVPIAVAIGLARYRLYDIDLVINRTLVYGALTATWSASTRARRWASGALVRAPARPPPCSRPRLVAVLVAPLRERLQRAVNRLLYGAARRPYAVLAALGRAARRDAGAGGRAAGDRRRRGRALRLPYAPSSCRRRRVAAGVAGTAGRAARRPACPLTSTGRDGRPAGLAAAAGRGASRADRRLLDDLARQAGVAVHAVRLTRRSAALARAAGHRARGGAPAPAARPARRPRPAAGRHRAAARAAGDRLPHDPAAAARCSLELRGADAGRDRRHPPAGLRACARRPGRARPGRGASQARPRASADGLRRSRSRRRSRCRRCRPRSRSPPTASPGGDDQRRPPRRRARAAPCALRLNGALEVEVSDDGRGLPAGRRAGVGLSSMRERAAELGGTCASSAAPGGGTRRPRALPVGTARGVTATEPIRVLIADDHPVFRDGLRALLDADAGHRGGRRGRERRRGGRAGARELQPDVVLMDLQMPERERHRGHPPDRRGQPARRRAGPDDVRGRRLRLRRHARRRARLSAQGRRRGGDRARDPRGGPRRGDLQPGDRAPADAPSSPPPGRPAPPRRSPS